MSDLMFTVDKDHPVPVEEKGGQVRVKREDLAQLVISLSYWGYAVWVEMEEGSAGVFYRLRYFRLPLPSNRRWWDRFLGR